MWDGSTSKISQQTLIQGKEDGGSKLCHFPTKVKSLKLPWVKRPTSESNSTWKILQKLFYKCQNINTYFRANHHPLSNLNIPDFYSEIPKLYMRFFKKEPNNLIEILNQSFQLNENLKVNHKYIYNKLWENRGILYFKDILNENCDFLSHDAMKKTYNLSIIRSCHISIVHQEVHFKKPV